MATSVTTTNVNPDEKARLDVFQSMPAPLQKVAESLDKKELQMSTGVLKVNYQAGELVKTVMADKAKFGEDAVEKLAAYLGKNRDDLYALNTIVMTYTWPELEALSLRNMANGGRISLKHVREVLKLSNASDREKMWERVFTESLSGNVIQHEVKSGNYKLTKPRTGGGRPPSKPSSPQSGFQQIANQTQTLNNRFEKAWKNLFDDVDEADDDKLDTTLLDRIQKAESELEKLENFIMTYRPRLEKNRARVESVVAARKQEAAPANKGKKAKTTTKKRGRPAKQVAAAMA